METIPNINKLENSFTIFNTIKDEVKLYKSSNIKYSDILFSILLNNLKKINIKEIIARDENFFINMFENLINTNITMDTMVCLSIFYLDLKLSNNNIDIKNIDSFIIKKSNEDTKYKIFINQNIYKYYFEDLYKTYLKLKFKSNLDLDENLVLNKLNDFNKNYLDKKLLNYNNLYEATINIENIKNYYTSIDYIDIETIYNKMNQFIIDKYITAFNIRNNMVNFKKIFNKTENTDIGISILNNIAEYNNKYMNNFLDRKSGIALEEYKKNLSIIKEYYTNNETNNIIDCLYNLDNIEAINVLFSKCFRLLNTNYYFFNFNAVFEDITQIYNTYENLNKINKSYINFLNDAKDLLSPYDSIIENIIKHAGNSLVLRPMLDGATQDVKNQYIELYKEVITNIKSDKPIKEIIETITTKYETLKTELVETKKKFDKITFINKKIAASSGMPANYTYIYYDNYLNNTKIISDIKKYITDNTIIQDIDLLLAKLNNNNFTTYFIKLILIQIKTSISNIDKLESNNDTEILILLTDFNKNFAAIEANINNTTTGINTQIKNYEASFTKIKQLFKQNPSIDAGNIVSINSFFTGLRGYKSKTKETMKSIVDDIIKKLSTTSSDIDLDIINKNKINLQKKYYNNIKNNINLLSLEKYKERINSITPDMDENFRTSFKQIYDQKITSINEQISKNNAEIGKINNKYYLYNTSISYLYNMNYITELYNTFYLIFNYTSSSAKQILTKNMNDPSLDLADKSLINEDIQYYKKQVEHDLDDLHGQYIQIQDPSSLYTVETTILTDIHKDKMNFNKFTPLNYKQYFGDSSSSSNFNATILDVLINISTIGIISNDMDPRFDYNDYNFNKYLQNLNLYYDINNGDITNDITNLDDKTELYKYIYYKYISRNFIIILNIIDFTPLNTTQDKINALKYLILLLVTIGINNTYISQLINWIIVNKDSTPGIMDDINIDAIVLNYDNFFPTLIMEISEMYAANDTHDIFRKYFYTGGIDTTNYADANHPQRLNIPESEYNILKSIYDGRENYKEKFKILLNKSIKKFFNTTPYNIIQTSGPPISYTSSNPNIKQNIKYFINKILYEFLDTTYIENKISKFIDNKYLITSEKKSITISSITKPINNNIDYHTSLDINDAVEYNGLKYSYSTANNNKIIETLFNDTIVPIDDITTITGDDYIKSKLFINKINMDNRTLHCMYIGRVNKYREDFNQLVNLYQNNLKLIDKTNIDPTNFRNIYKKKLEKLYRLFVYHLHNYFILCINKLFVERKKLIIDSVVEINKRINSWLDTLPKDDLLFDSHVNVYIPTDRDKIFHYLYFLYRIFFNSKEKISGFGFKEHIRNSYNNVQYNFNTDFTTVFALPGPIVAPAPITPPLINKKSMLLSTAIGPNPDIGKTLFFESVAPTLIAPPLALPAATHTYYFKNDLYDLKIPKNFAFRNPDDTQHFDKDFKKIDHVFPENIENILEIIDITGELL